MMDIMEIMERAPINNPDNDTRGADAVYYWLKEPGESKINEDLPEIIERRATMSLRSVKDAVIEGVTKYYPNPLLLTPTHEALIEFRDTTIALINYFIKDINQYRSSFGMDKLKHIGALDVDDVVRIVYGYYEVVNWAYSTAEVDSGVCMCMSYDEKRDPDGKWTPLDDIVSAFASELIKADYNTKALLSNMATNTRTKIHICAPIVENRNKHLKNCIMFNNGVFVPELYQNMKRLLTYREAYKDYDLYLPHPIAANFIYNPDNDPNAVFAPGAAADGGLFPQIPAPVMIDGFDICQWFVDMFGYSPVLLKAIWSMLLAVLRVFNSDYDRAFFLMDNGVGSTGKSTLIQLIIQILGEECTMELSLLEMADKSNKFVMEKLAELCIYFIYSHENDPQAYHEKLIRFKQLCTGDAVNVNRKNKPILTRIFRGRMVHAFNAYRLKTADDTESFYRRLLPFPFVRTIDNGNGEGEIARNENIKSAWIKKQEVIDWVATEAVRLNIEEVPMPDETLALIDKLQASNDAVLGFVNSYVNNMTQGWLRVDWLYPAYKEYCRLGGKKNSKEKSLDVFEEEVTKILDKKASQWVRSNKDVTNVNQYTVPLIPDGSKPNAILLVGNDGIYSGLNYINNDHKHDQYKLAHSGLLKMYYNDKPGSVRNVYYRKPHDELNHLLGLGKELINAHYCEDELTTEEIIDMLLSGNQFVAAGVFEQPVPKSQLTIRQDPVYAGQKKTYDFIANRIQTLQGVVQNDC